MKKVTFPTQPTRKAFSIPVKSGLYQCGEDNDEEMSETPEEESAEMNEEKD